MQLEISKTGMTGFWKPVCYHCYMKTIDFPC